MIYKLLRDGVQISHGSTINLALTRAINDGEAMHPFVVKGLLTGMEFMQFGDQPEYSIVKEPAFDGQMVVNACESDMSMRGVLNGMEQGLLLSRQ